SIVEIKLNRLKKGRGFKFLTRSDYFLETHLRTNMETVLCDDGAFVKIHRDEMRRDPDDFDALFVSLPISLRPRKTGQQRGVNVDDFVFVPPHEIRRQDLHEPCQHDKVDFIFVEGLERCQLALQTVFPRNVNKREPGFARERFEVASI